MSNKTGKKIGWSLIAIIILSIMVFILVVIGKGCGPVYEHHYNFSTYGELREFFREDLRFPTYFPEGFDPRKTKENTATWSAMSMYGDKKKSIPKSEYYEWVRVSVTRDLLESKIENMGISKINIYTELAASFRMTPKKINSSLVRDGQKYLTDIRNYPEETTIATNTEFQFEDGGGILVAFTLHTEKGLSETEFNEIKETLEKKYLDEAFKMLKSMEVW